MLDSRLRRKIREQLDVTNPQVPIEVEKAQISKSEVIGEIGGYFTLAGKRIHHPNGYARKGWSNMRYETDSRIIRITTTWLSNFIRENKPYTT